MNISKKMAILIAFSYGCANFGMEKEKSFSELFHNLFNEYQKMMISQAIVSANQRLLQIKGHPSHEKHEKEMLEYSENMKKHSYNVEELLKECELNASTKDQKEDVEAIKNNLKEAKPTLK